MPVKHKKKVTKQRGHKTHGGGSKKKRRGKGSKGGSGRANYMGQKRLKAIKEGLLPEHKKLKPKPKKPVKNIRDIDFSQKSIDLTKYKVLSMGSVPKSKSTVNVDEISEKALEKLKKSNVKVKRVKKDKKEEKKFGKEKTEKKEDKKEGA